MITGKKKAKEDKHVEEILEELEEEEAYRRKQEAKELKREQKKAAKRGEVISPKSSQTDSSNTGSGNSLNKDVSKFY